MARSSLRRGLFPGQTWSRLEQGCSGRREKLQRALFSEPEPTLPVIQEMRIFLRWHSSALEWIVLHFKALTKLNLAGTSKNQVFPNPNRALKRNTMLKIKDYMNEIQMMGNVDLNTTDITYELVNVKTPTIQCHKFLKIWFSIIVMRNTRRSDYCFASPTTFS